MHTYVSVIGNLTRDVELRYTPLGNTAIASTYKYTINNDKKEEICFIDITFMGKTAEIANQYLKKGSKVFVDGRLKFDQWTDNNGQNRSKLTKRKRQTSEKNKLKKPSMCKGNEQ